MRALRILAATVVTLVALGSSACGSSTSSTAGGGPATYSVSVDNQTPKFNGIFYAFFPDKVTVHPDDSVVFTSVFRGEAHSVSFGPTIDAGLAKYDQAFKANPYIDDHSIPELSAIPDMFPPTAGLANQVSAQPCFIQSGSIPGPGATPCGQHTLVNQPQFDGTAAFYSSGYLADQQTFTVHVAPTTKPGTYRYMCTNHRADMAGAITVVSPDQTADTPDQVTNTAAQQLSDRTGALQPLIDQANASPRLVGGIRNGTTGDSYASIFAPKQVTVPHGGSLTWNIDGYHNLAFAAPTSVDKIVIQQPDGAVYINPLVLSPQGGTPGVPSPPSNTDPVWKPPAPPATTVDLGTWDGTSFFSSGVISAFYPYLFNVSVTFSTPGTYSYRCLIHPQMNGTVTVT